MKIFQDVIAVAMISGTAIGAGMLGLPASLATLNWPTAWLSLVIVAIFMGLSAFYTLALAQMSGQHTNIFSEPSHHVSKGLSFCIHLFYCSLLVSLMCVYLNGLGSLAQKYLSLTHLKALLWVWLFLNILLSFETKVILWINKLLWVGLLLGFLLMIMPLQADLSRLSHYELVETPFDLPSFLVTSFGFHIVLPMLAQHIPSQRLKVDLLIGLAIVLFLYTTWSMLFLGSIDQATIIQVRHASIADILSLLMTAEKSSSHFGIILFSLSALLTSALGVGMALKNYVQKNSPTSAVRVFYGLLFFNLLAVLYIPWAFLKLLSFAGTYVCLLLGLYPSYLYYLKKKSFLACLTMAFFSLVMLLEWYSFLCN